MHRSLLNLSAVRCNRLPRFVAPGLTLEEIAASPGKLLVSRRAFLSFTGVTAVGMAPALKTLEASYLGPFEVAGDEDRLAFKLGGQERWVIEPRLFGGSPRLHIERRDGFLRLQLFDAKYPGTNLPADMVCELREGILGWRMKLRLAIGGFKSEVPFERWLAGAEPARSSIKVNAPVCRLGRASALMLSGAAEAGFHPDWLLAISGSGIARLSGPGPDLVSDSLLLCPLEPGAPSLVSQPAARRTLLALRRGAREWPLDGALAAPHGGKLVAAGSAFDVLHIEAGEGGLGPVRHALVFESNDKATKLAFEPGGNLTGDRGRPLSLPLQSARYAVAFASAGEQTALLADFAPEAVWLHADGCSMELGAGPDAPPLELLAFNGKVEAVRCEPALRRVVAPLEGAIVSPVQVAPGTRLALVSDADHKSSASGGPVRVAARAPIIIRPPAETPGRPSPAPAQPAPAQPTPAPAPGPAIRAPIIVPRVDTPVQPVKPQIEVAKPEFSTKPPLDLTWRVSVVRPDDMLSLDFEFINLQLQTSGGAHLARTNATKPAYVVVHFPPQHIAEQAIPEDATSVPGTVPPGVQPPLDSRLSGPSQLVFRVPNALAGNMPYTLESLLDWSKWELFVAPAAVPHPAPPRNPLLLDRPGGFTIPPPGGDPIPPGGIITLPPRINKQIRPLPSGAIRQQVIKPDAASPGVATPIERAGIAAQVPGALAVRPKIVEPKFSGTEDRYTAIEAPWHLTLSPSVMAAWAHSTSAVEHSGRAELWHTRLGVRGQDGQNEGASRDTVDEKYDWYRTVRAIWSPDYDPDNPAPNTDTPFMMSLRPSHRSQLVKLTADSSLDDWEKRVVRVEKLMLTSLGAWINARYAADRPKATPPFSVAEWLHIANMGRDQFVKVVEDGYLLPFGHRAVLVQITERKFHGATPGNTAYLRKRMFIVVREPEKVYTGTGFQYQGREMPLKRVRLNTLSTPNLDLPPKDTVDGIAAPYDAFWPDVGGQDFLWSMVAEDGDGQTSEFSAPLIFVAATVGEDVTKAQKAVNDYNKDPRRQRPFDGQKVAFAESSGGKPGVTSLPASDLTFGAAILAKPQPLQAAFYPLLQKAQVRLPAAEQIAGPSNAPPGVPIALHDAYLKNGFDAAKNAGQVFAELLKSSPLTFPASKSGGVATPDLDITGLSRKFGPIGGSAADLAKGVFDPKKFFEGQAAKILGGIPLADILPKPGPIGDGKNVPKLTTETIKDSSGLPTAIKSTLFWQPKVESAFILATKDNTKLMLNVEVVTKLQTGESTYDIKGELKNFDIQLIRGAKTFIVVHFNEFSYASGTGRKDDVNVDIERVDFTGPLSFVNKLKEFLSSLGGGLYLDITAAGIEAGIRIAIPTVAVGVFSLQNMSLSAVLTIPFTGDDAIALRFAFCERHNPFLLTVSIFGGGGFFGITLQAKEGEYLKELELSLEFGANFTLDIGVASGGVYLMAGIYIKMGMVEGQQTTILTGFVRCGGSLEILGIITISVEFNLSLTYEDDGSRSRVWGRATLTVEIEILFFSVSVSMTVEREFAGSGGSAMLPDESPYEAPRLASAGGGLPIGMPRGVPAPINAPSIAQVLSQSDWNEYCEMFA